MDVTADPLEKLRQRTSMKWRAFPDDVLPLFVAETDYPLAPVIAEALTAAIQISDTGYAPPVSELPQAFAGFAQSRWGWTVDPAQVWTTTDVGVAIVETLRRVTSPGDGVIITTPVYFPFFDLVKEAGASVVEVPLAGGIDDGWSLDLDGLEHAFKAGARAFLLCNPHNPVGLAHSADDLRAVADLAARYGATVVSDEIHGPLTYADAEFTPFLSVSDAARTVGVCVTAASKAWNLAGLKCAIMVSAGGPNQAIVGTMPDEVYWRTSILGLTASIAGYRDGADWLDGILSSLDANRRLLATLLAEQLPSVKYRMPQATYLAWLDLRALGWGDDPAVHALEHAKVALSNGPPFGRQGNGFARLNLACSPDTLTEAVARLARAAVALRWPERPSRSEHPSGPDAPISPPVSLSPSSFHPPRRRRRASNRLVAPVTSGARNRYPTRRTPRPPELETTDTGTLQQPRKSPRIHDLRRDDPHNCRNLPPQPVLAFLLPPRPLAGRKVLLE